MEVDNVARVRLLLVWCLLVTTAIAPTGCHGAGAAPEAGNATVPRRCHGGKCLIAYRQPEVELMAVLDPEHALGSMLAIRPGVVVRRSMDRGRSAYCDRRGRGIRYTPCVPQRNPGARNGLYDRGRHGHGTVEMPV